MKVSQDQEIINRILSRSVEEILPSPDMLREMLLSGKRLKVYQGFDPTADTLHIGHTVMMRKLEDFRKLGHEVIMLIGDFTGRIGDPTDKGSARTQLTEEKVKENFKMYREQASKILNMDDPENPVKVLYNNDWLGALKFAEIVEIASEFTVQQMLKRDMFQRRLESNEPIYLHEFLYPLMQGWDSVAMEIDVELGGNDQLFNMLAGRGLVKKFHNKEKIVVSGKLLTTVSGDKMGKSEGNMIKLSDTPNEMYGNVMAFADSQILQGFELLTDCTDDQLQEYEKRMKDGENPMSLKKDLAFRITSEHKGEKAASGAQHYFEEVFQNRTFEADVETIVIPKENVMLLDLLSTNGNLDKSRSEIKRMIEQGAVQIDNKKADDWKELVNPEDGMIIKVGRKVRKIIIK